MKKMLLITSLFLFASVSWAQPGISNAASTQKEFTLHPLYKIDLRTIEGNLLKGLLLQVDDSSLVVYPGNAKEWNKNKAYKPVMFSYAQVGDILLKRTEMPEERMIPSVVVAADQKGKVKVFDPVEFHRSTTSISGDPKEISYSINGDILLFIAFKKQTQ
jgi:hypothetical protein